MANSDSLAWTSLALSTVVALSALLLGLRQWWERSTRVETHTDAERKYFKNQDLRRGIGVLMMGIVAAGIFVGSRLPTYLIDPNGPAAKGSLDSTGGAWIVPAVDVHPNRLFLSVWLSVFVLLVVSLGLALTDWAATRRYARQQRRAMAQERLDLLRDTFRKSDSDRNGAAFEFGQDDA